MRPNGLRVPALIRVFASAVFMPALTVSAQPGELGLPIDCTLGTDCFVQQYPDLASGTAVEDPWCGGASYDGHDGTDIRLRSMVEEAAGVSVLAVADGRVLRVRDEVPDRLIRTPEDLDAVADIECGNGLVIDHGNGLETQYCHMKLGSLVVAPGDKVSKGDKLGQVGASGLTEFPHVHLSVMQDGADVDPTSGRKIGEGCAVSEQGAQSLWDDTTAALLTAQTDQILQMGFADAAVDFDSLVVDGAPAQPDGASPALVGWAWFSNLREGDVITLRVLGPDGAVLAENTLEALDRNKATYLAFTGKRGTPAPGQYGLDVVVTGRDGRRLVGESSIEIH